MVPLLATHPVIRACPGVRDGAGPLLWGWRQKGVTRAGRGADAPGDARARSRPGALQEAATAATGRGGATGGPTPKATRAPSSQVFKGNRHDLTQPPTSCRRRRGQPDVLWLSCQVSRAPHGLLHAVPVGSMRGVQVAGPGAGAESRAGSRVFAPALCSLGTGLSPRPSPTSFQHPRLRSRNYPQLFV